MAEKSKVHEAFSLGPLHFEANQGQVDDQVKFLSRGPGYSLFLTQEGPVLSLRTSKAVDRPGDKNLPEPGVDEAAPTKPAVLKMKLVGASAEPTVVGQKELSWKANYFIGNDPTQWRTEVATFGQVKYEEVSPGLDLIFYGNQKRLEYDFVVKPGADPSAIKMKFEGADQVVIDDDGNLVLEVAGGRVIQNKPLVYQEVDGRRLPLEGRYALLEEGLVGFHVAKYDREQDLVIDPVLVFSTYLGGASDESGYGISVDAAGSAYVTGYTSSTDFPTNNAFQPSIAGDIDAFVTKFDSAGGLVYSTYLGGTNGALGHGISVDSAGNAYVTGYTSSTDFPTLNPYQATILGKQNAFVAKLNSNGRLVYSTYLGGSEVDYGYSIALDPTGNAYIIGCTRSTDFPTLNAFQPAHAGGSYDVFVTKFDSAGRLVYSTYLGGTSDESGYGISVDAAGNAYLTGDTTSTNFPTLNAFQPSIAGITDAFVTKLNSSGRLVYSTYLGGTGGDFSRGISVDTAGNAYITGYTSSTNFPTLNAFQPSNAGAVDVFVTKFDSAGQLVYSTYLGGSGNDYGYGLSVDSAGNAYLTGYTNSTSTHFPTLASYQPAPAGGSYDVFVTKLNSAGQLAYSSYWGGAGGDYGYGLSVDSAGNAYVTGYTTSTDFPTRNAFQPSNAGGQDAFVTKLDFTPPTIKTTLPTDGASNVAINTLVQASFNEALDPTTINAGTFTVAGVTGTITYDVGTKTATFTPAANLSSSQTYTATITTGVKDMVGNAMASNYVFSFTTGDDTAPRVTSTTPAANATGVALNAVITAVFSEAMDPATINTGTFIVSGNTGAGNISNYAVSPITGTVSYDAGTKTATFTPAADLAYKTTYAATITTGVTDLAGNHLAADYLWAFTTGNLSESNVGGGCFISTINY